MPRETYRGHSDPDFYSAGGWGYHDREGDRAFLRKHFVQEFGLRSGSRLLDAGCGDGWWSSLFHEEGFVVTSCDISEDAIRVARVRHRGPAYSVADAAAGGWGSFETVFARGLTVSGTPRAPAAAAVMRRLVSQLSPNGTLLVVRATDGSGRDGPSEIGRFAVNPLLSDLVAMLEPLASVFKVTVIGSSVQIGARP